MKKYKGLLISILVMAGIASFMLFVATSNHMTKIQYLQNLDYQVKMNNDGSMNVVETWDIDIIKTNTLVRNFNLSKTKFGDITNVQITDLQTGEKFKKINEEMYHVPEGEFYALNVNSNNFEIAFGIGMENKKRK